MTSEYDIRGTLSAKADGIVSISLSDSWTGRKILESIGQLHISPDEAEVCFFYPKSLKSCSKN